MKNTLMVGVLVVALGLVVAVVLWVILPSSSAPVGPDPAEAGDEEIQQFVASDKFKKLPQEDRERYLRDLRDNRRRGLYRMSGLTDEERQKARRNIRDTRSTQMSREMDAFLKMNPEQQVAYLDKQIDERGSRRDEFRRRREAAQKTETTTATKSEERPRERGRWRGRNMSPDEAQRWREKLLSEHPPLERAQRTEYFRRLRERMRERFPDRTRRGR